MDMRTLLSCCTRRMNRRGGGCQGETWYVRRLSPRGVSVADVQVQGSRRHEQSSHPGKRPETETLCRVPEAVMSSAWRCVLHIGGGIAARADRDISLDAYVNALHRSWPYRMFKASCTSNADHSSTSPCSALFVATVELTSL
jgi:hypothetical protein